MRNPLNSFISPSYVLSSSLSSRGDPERELHSQPWLVGAWLSDLRDDTGPVALPQAQGARQTGGGGQTSAWGPGGVLGQVLGGGEGHLQTGEREDDTGHIIYKRDKGGGGWYVKIKHVTFSSFGVFSLFGGRPHNYWSMNSLPSFIFWLLFCQTAYFPAKSSTSFISWLLKWSLFAIQISYQKVFA